MLQYFDFSADYILEDNFVQLRPLTETDYEHLLPFALQEPDIWKYSLVPVAVKEELKNYIETALDARKANIHLSYMIKGSKNMQAVRVFTIYNRPIKRCSWDTPGTANSFREPD